MFKVEQPLCMLPPEMSRRTIMRVKSNRCTVLSTAYACGQSRVDAENGCITSQLDKGLCD